MPLTTQSILRSERTLPLEEIDRMIDTNLNQLEQLAEKEFKGRNFTIRDLVGSDLPGNSTNIFTETSSGATGYATTTGGDNTAIADDTILMIWGIQLPNAQDWDTLIVTGFRISVGASLRAQFSVGSILQIKEAIGTAVAAPYATAPVGYLMTPIVVTSQTTLKIEEYSTTDEQYLAIWQGAVAEIQGKTLEA